MSIDLDIWRQTKQIIGRNIPRYNFQNLLVEIIKEGKYYIFTCPVLEVSSYGLTFEKAEARFERALEIFFLKKPQPKAT